MTGAYMRVKRNEKWINIEVEHLTDEERTEIFKNKDSEELIRWINALCKAVKILDDAYESATT